MAIRGFDDPVVDDNGADAWPWRVGVHRLSDHLPVAEPYFEPGAVSLVTAVPPGPAIALHRYTVGHGDLRGALRVRLTNPSASCSVEALYVDFVHASLRLYWHTLRVTVDGGRVDPPTRAHHKLT